MSDQGWHKADIRAAVEKKGETLSSLALKQGIHPMACRRAVVARNTPGEKAIAQLIAVPLWELWPDRWRQPEETGGPAVRIDNRRRDDAELKDFVKAKIISLLLSNFRHAQPETPCREVTMASLMAFLGTGTDAAMAAAGFTPEEIGLYAPAARDLFAKGEIPVSSRAGSDRL
ncbi:MAG TPA: helix-turn-helix domain-containing protein [Candidatus Sulfotelmatobacter sp.]|jgi:Ner family transcriptional regulator|nr:helix-turn-helix domain-containing protein [Candidatus Sulfotelmatobacter sp.]